MATFSCSREGNLLEWVFDGMHIETLEDRSNASMIFVVDGINFTVSLIFLNTSLTISNFSFTAIQAAGGRNFSCAGQTAASAATIHVVTDGKPL